MVLKLKTVFYAQFNCDPPAQPVREWPRRLTKAERVEIGADIQAAQSGWPLGMPLVKHLSGDLRKVRSN